MATLAHSSSDAPQRQLNGTEPKVHHLDTVAGLLPSLEPAHVGQPAERRLEGKIHSFSRQTIDLSHRPYPDDQQWSYLASLPRIDASTVELIAREATDRGSVVGVRIATIDEEDTAPWAQLPSRKRNPAVITEPLPRVVRAVLAQRLCVDKAGLPSPLLNQIKRLAAFQNPEFYKKQSMRLSTATTPSVIACAEDLPQYVGLPRGCQTEFEALMRDYGVSVEVEDHRVGGERLPLQFHR